MEQQQVVAVRPLITLADIRPVEDLQRLVWGCPDLDVVPCHILLGGAEHGACLLGAFRDGRLVGFVYGFPAGGDSGYIYSHLAAVHPEQRGLGYGLALKQAQAEWARSRGYNRIVWTFDPLQARNAHFNLHILGATGHRYLVDHYGELDDDLNRGVPTDRLEVDWWLDGRPRARPTESFSIPRPLPAEHRLDWRLKSRRRFQEAFAAGLSLVDFTFDSQESVYGLG